MWDKIKLNDRKIKYKWYIGFLLLFKKSYTNHDDYNRLRTSVTSKMLFGIYYIVNIKTTVFTRPI